MNLGGSESCVVITDPKREAIGTALYEVVTEITDDAAILQYPPGEQHGAEPPDAVAAAMAGADVALAPTTKSLTHTRARGAATDAGTRVATLPGITEDVFIQGLDANYDAIREHSETLHSQLEDASTLEVTSPQGTAITITPGEREWHLDTGIVHEPGTLSNLPAGEVFISPETATGTYVVDGTMRPHGLLENGQTLEFEVEDGTVTSVSDAAIAEQLDTAAQTGGSAAYNVAELGIGTNVGVTELLGSVLLDEKAAGTVHMAIGDDASIGGNTDAPVHLDGILREPTVLADGEEISLPQSE